LNEPDFGYVSSQDETQKPRHAAQVTSPRSVYSPDASEDDSWVTPAPRVPQKQTKAAPSTTPSSNDMPLRQAATTAARSPRTIAPVVLGSNTQLRASPTPPVQRVSPTPIVPHLTASVGVSSRTIDLQELIKKASYEVQFYNSQAEDFRIKVRVFTVLFVHNIIQPRFAAVHIAPCYCLSTGMLFVNCLKSGRWRTHETKLSLLVFA
jgi:hypothetical protein